MYEFKVRVIGTTEWRVIEADLSSLTIEKNDRNEVYLAGSVTVMNLDTGFDYLYARRVYGYSQLECTINYNDEPTGLLSLGGKWDWRARVCTLKVSNDSIYVPFENIFDKEYIPDLDTIEYDFSSTIYKTYVTDGYTPDHSSVCSGTAPSWDIATTYGAAREVSSGEWEGDSTNTIFGTGSDVYTYYSLRPNNVGNATSDTYWWYQSPNSTTYGQERAEFQFDDSAVYIPQSKLWVLGGCTADDYTKEVIGLNIKENIDDILFDNGYAIATDWLDYAKAVNSDYEDKLVLVNTKVIELIKLSELISIIEETFNCRYYLNGNQLYFLHKSEQVNGWNSSLPTENDLRNYDSWVLTRSSDKFVREHRLTLTNSSRTDHANSVIVYDNEHKDIAEIKPSYDVDFIYTVKEDGISGLVTLDSSNKVKYSTIWNPYLVPEDIHTSFYLVGREYSSGLLNGNFVSLYMDYLEDTEFDALPNLNINNFNMFYEAKLSIFPPKLYGKLEKVVYSIGKNSLKVTMKA